MILKLYIRRKLFQLPRKQEDLTEIIKESFYKRKPLVKSGLTKLYRISDIESQNIKYEKNVNIFLVNLYLLVLEYKEELVSDKDITITLSDDNIVVELSKKLNEDLKGLSIEELEGKVDKYISGNFDDPASLENAMKHVDTVFSVPFSEMDTESNDQNLDVDFSIAWVKAMDKKIKE